jgi:threonine synthase
MDFSGKKIVCIVTGNGIKVADTAIKNAAPFLQLPADLSVIEKALGF